MINEINPASVYHASCRIYQLERAPLQAVALYDGDKLEDAQAAFNGACAIPAFADARVAEFKAGGSYYSRRFAAGGLMLELIACTF